MTQNDVIKTLTALGETFKDSQKMESIMAQAFAKNAWFTKENIAFCLAVWADELTQPKLEAWRAKYPTTSSTPKRIGIVMAGNVPMVGFHDLLAVLVSGHKPVVKLSSSDEALMKYSIEFINNRLGGTIEIVERVKDVDGIIATGSNNTARYFEYYYKEIPKVIRKNRTSIALLNGDETTDDLQNLAHDIFRYFGLGCRNVTKIYIPEGYDLVHLLDQFIGYSNVIDHHKYANNYTYHKAIFLMNQTPHKDTGYLLIKEDENLHSPLACLFYSYYDPNDAVQIIETNKNDIQVVVSNMDIPNSLSFGTTQDAGLMDYADGVDTMEFLTKTEFN